MKESMGMCMRLTILLVIVLCGCRRQSDKTPETATPQAAEQRPDNPGPNTTFQLIDKAVAGGALDKETALLYKVYADFDDRRLPASYRGTEDDWFEVRSIRQVRKNWSALSQPARDLLAPFLMPPDQPGSWNELPTAGRAASLDRRNPWSDLLARPVAAASVQWASVVVTVGGVQKARIWWMPDRRPQDEARAAGFKAELERYLWKKLTDTFGEPLRDDYIHRTDGTTPGNGPDGLFDIYLTGIGRSLELSLQEPCDGKPRPGLILLSVKANNSELGHEIMHAIVDGYELLGCHDDYDWMNEATAEWSQHFTYSDNQEHKAADHFLMFPSDRLNVVGGSSGSHEYGAYLWFFNLSGPGIDPAPVKATWAAARTNDDIDAIDKVAGGFKKQWPVFLANNWNGMPDAGGPHREYWAWDKLPNRAREEYTYPQKTVQGVVDISLPNYGAAKFPIHHEIYPLAAQYNHFRFRPDPKLHQVWIRNDYAGADPRAVVQAIVKIKDEDWLPYKDWSNDKVHFFCRDVAKENIEELVLIVSNLDLQNAQDFRGLPPALGGDETINQSPLEVNVSALPCNDWVGTVEYKSFVRAEGGDTVRTSAKADVRFRMDLGQTSAAGGALEYYKATGTVHWEIHEMVEYCAEKHAFGKFPAEASLVISLGPDSLFYVFQNESAGSSTKITVACEGGPSEFHFEFKQWLPQGFLGMLVGDAAEIVGSREDDPATGDGWKWRFKRVLAP